jgi:hypothetical protein
MRNRTVGTFLATRKKTGFFLVATGDMRNRTLTLFQSKSPFGSRLNFVMTLDFPTSGLLSPKNEIFLTHWIFVLFWYFFEEPVLAFFTCHTVDRLQKMFIQFSNFKLILEKLIKILFIIPYCYDYGDY